VLAVAAAEETQDCEHKNLAPVHARRQSKLRSEPAAAGVGSHWPGPPSAGAVAAGTSAIQASASALATVSRLARAAGVIVSSGHRRRPRHTPRHHLSHRLYSGGAHDQS
jgi:hypothetical protein